MKFLHVASYGWSGCLNWWPVGAASITLPYASTVGQTPHPLDLRVRMTYTGCTSNDGTNSRAGLPHRTTEQRSYKRRPERTDVFIQGVHKMLGQIQQRVHQIKTMNEVPTNTGWDVRVCFIAGLQNISGQIQQFSASKRNKNCIQTQSENEWFLSWTERLRGRVKWKR